MAKKKVKVEDSDREIFKKASREDLIKIIKIFKEENEKLKEEKKLKDKNKSNFQMISKLIYNCPSVSQRKWCKFFGMNRKTFSSYKADINHGNVYRTDFKSNNFISKSRIIELFEMLKGTSGSYKIHGILTKEGIEISRPTVHRILKTLLLFPATIKKHFTSYELKDTKKSREYLFTKDLIATYKPGEAFSMDFMHLSIGTKKFYVHGIIDVVIQAIASLIISDSMTSDIVLRALKELPSTAKYINTDYGTQYFESKVQEHLTRNNIKHSCGKVGKSTDNG